MRGAWAQEEDLYRRSDIYRHNRMFFQGGQPYPLAEAERNKTDGIAMATQGVLIFRSTIDTGYEMLEMARQATIITAVAPRFPDMTFDNEGNEQCAKHEARQKMYATIKAACEAAKEAKCIVLIFSAFGCGAYKNPPREVAEILYSVLTDYQQSLMLVTIGIRDEIFEVGAAPPSLPPNLAMQSQSNYEVFKEVFAFV